MAEASSKIPGFSCSAFPNRKIYTVHTCQFGILCSMSEVPVFSSPRIIEKICNHP